MADLDPSRRFGENVMVYRRRAGLSQEELGFRASLHRTEISQLERGVRLPRLDTIIKLAGGLKVEPGELLRGIKWRPGRFANGRFDVSEPRRGA